MTFEIFWLFPDYLVALKSFFAAPGTNWCLFLFSDIGGCGFEGNVCSFESLILHPYNHRYQEKFLNSFLETSIGKLVHNLYYAESKLVTKYSIYAIAMRINGMSHRLQSKKYIINNFSE